MVIILKSCIHPFGKKPSRISDSDEHVYVGQKIKKDVRTDRILVNRDMEFTILDGKTNESNLF